jgi:hypothetical protein
MSQKTHICFTSIAANLWDEEINAKWSIFVLQVGLDGMNLAHKSVKTAHLQMIVNTYLGTQDLGGISHAADYTHTPGIRDCSSQLRACRYIHTCEEGMKLSTIARCAW